MNSDPILKLALPGVQQLVPYTPGKPVSELERELGIANIIKLASNENPLGTNPSVASAIQAALPDITRYPDGSGYHLKLALAHRHRLLTDQITLGNGSSEILDLVARTFVSEGLEVIFSQHAFALYPLVTQAVGGTARVVPARQFGHDLAAMLERVNDKTRLVFIANPNNPTGTFIKQDELEWFLSELPESVLCVLDEAYFDYVPENLAYCSVDWLERFPNLIITRTFSKAYGLAGVRIGYGLSSSLIADLLNRVRHPFNNNTLALVAAECALADTDYLCRTVAANHAGMRQLTDAFRASGLRWIPSAGNFVTLDLGRPALPVFEALLNKGVIVRPVANYEMPDHLRISIGTEEENQLFIRSLGEVLDDV